MWKRPDSFVTTFSVNTGITVVETELEPVRVVPAKTGPDRPDLVGGGLPGKEILVAEVRRVEEAEEETKAVGLVFPIPDAAERQLGSVEFEGSPSPVVARAIRWSKPRTVS